MAFEGPVDEDVGQERPQTLEMPQVLQHLSELVALAMRHARDPSHSSQLQLASIQMTVKILVDVVNCTEMRDVQQGLRHIDTAIARSRSERERWE
jgi:hypothetical protein